MSCVSLPDMLFLGPRSSLRVNCHGFTWSNVAHSSVCPSARRWSSPVVVASRSCKRASTAKTYHGKMSEKCTVPTPKVMIDSILRGTLDCKPCLKHTKTIRTTRAWRASTTSCGKVPSWCIYFLYAFGRGRGDKTYFAPPLNLVWKGARGKDPTYSSSLMQVHPIFSQVLRMLLHKVGHRHFLNRRQCFASNTASKSCSTDFANNNLPKIRQQPLLIEALYPELSGATVKIDHQDQLWTINCRTDFCKAVKGFW